MFEVLLTTQDTLASAPAANAVLTSNSGVNRKVPLQVQGRGTWSSSPLAPGRYRLSTRFDRHDRALTIPVDVRVPAPPPDVAAAAHGDSEAGAQARARSALVSTLTLSALLAVLAAVGFALRRSRRGRRMFALRGFTTTQAHPEPAAARPPARPHPRSNKRRRR